VPPVTVAILVLPLVHVPPDVVLLSEVVNPSHTKGVPVLAVGAGLTVTTVVAEQPVPAVYVIVAVPPETPVTTPVPEATVAMPVLVVVHVPGPLASLSVVVNDGQTSVVPVMLEGSATTVTTAVA